MDPLPRRWYEAEAAELAPRLLDKLLGMRVRRPIATQPSSHNSLKVGEREHGRRVRVEAGEARYELYVGAGQGGDVRHVEPSRSMPLNRYVVVAQIDSFQKCVAGK